MPKSTSIMNQPLVNRASESVAATPTATAASSMCLRRPSWSPMAPSIGPAMAATTRAAALA
jgi:hypothetical protein